MDEKALYEAVLGYLNFSDGTPNANFQNGLNRLFERAIESAEDLPHRTVLKRLREELERRKGTSPAFKDTTQAAAVLAIVADELLDAYREHHRDLLAHLPDADLFQPFFVARVFEAVLAQHGPWTERDRIVRGAIDFLNDFVGHRPLATLENGRKTQPYPNERVRPIPIYLRGVGVGVGPFRGLIERMLQVLNATDDDLLSAVYLDMELLDELALDPRAYDHVHPANSRPGYQFGEWDPHHLDNQGRYRRLVLRPTILQALLHWIEENVQAGEVRENLFWEASVALAGTVVLASGISGDRPEAHDSETSLATLVPHVAHCRDAFYLAASKKFLGISASATQPFARVRQYLNRFISRQRALQVQQDHLAQLYARIGYPEESRRQAESIATPSVRMRTEMQILLTKGRQLAKEGDAAGGAELVVKIRDLLLRAIGCGAMVDPWNILGFQGNYSVFRAVQDSIIDIRVGQLLSLVQKIFDLYAQLLKAAAAQGQTKVQQELEEGLREFADWWDQFATYEVSDVQRVCGRESAGSALFVARALSLWRQSGAAAGDVAFWRQHSREFTTPQAYALVIDALFEHGDLLTTRALLMHWLSQADAVPLEGGGASFFKLMLRWMQRCAVQANQGVAASDPSQNPETLVANLFDYLEANAGEYWRAPTLGDEALGDEPASSDDADDLFSAAYEGVTFQDSAADGREGELIEQGPALDDPLDYQADQFKQRLAFLQMRARLEQIAASMQWTDRDRHLLLCRQWVKQAAATKFQLLRLLDSLHAHRVPDPFGTQDSIIEFDRRQSTKYELLSNTIETCIDTAHAVRYLCSAGADTADAGPLFSWEASAIDLHRALRDADGARARKHLTRLFAGLRDAPLLYVPLDKGGNPRKLFESRYVRDVIKQTAQQLPRLGMFRETYKLLETTQTLEQRQTGEHQQVTEFNLLFPVAYTAVIENIVPELDQWAGKDDDETAATWISPVVEHFSRLWLEHSSGVQYGELDRALDDKAWKRSVKFIKTYGRALFTQSFMTVGNLRGILRQGVGEFLDHLVMEMDPYHPMPLALDIADARVTKKEAVRQLSFILRAILENYEVYQDYNSTTTQSDYGENLHLLLDLLRVLHSYERHRWSLEPAYVAHSILARSGRLGVAAFLEQAFVEETEAMADSFVKKLQRTERKCGIYLASIEDRISERFVRPLRLNRLLALLKPCIEQAAKGNTQSDAFQAFQSLVEEFVQTAPGAGIHVPDWLEKVEDEVARLLGGAHEFIHPAVLPVQRKSLSFTEFQKQLEHWDKPLEDGGAR